MNSKFNLLNQLKSKISFAITFCLIFCFHPLFCQEMTNVTITAESLWRNQGYGVSNHTFDIDTYNTSDFMNYPTNPDPTTGSCGTEYYTSSNVQLKTITNLAHNTLKIRPYSVNDATDYRNGVSTLDLVAMQGQINGTTLYVNRTPTDDAPYRFISSDADYNNSFQQADITMVQQLIIASRNDLTRPSWSWVHKDEVEINDDDFDDYPDMYDYVIDYNWPGADGIILPSNTTAQVTSDNDKYFTFRTTKTGDIIASSGSSDNSWVCGSGTYITGGVIDSRSSSQLPNKKVQAGSIVNLQVQMHSDEDIISSEFFIKIDNNDFDVQDVKFSGNFSPNWYYNSNTGILATSDFNTDLTPLAIEAGIIMEIALIAKQDVQHLSGSLGWSKERSTEITGTDESIIYPDLNLELASIIPANLFSEIRIIDGNPIVYIESSEAQTARLLWFNDQGILVSNSQVNLVQGENHFATNISRLGIYYLQVQGEKQISMTKTLVW